MSQSKRRGLGCRGVFLGFVAGVVLMIVLVAGLSALCGGVISAECVADLLGVTQPDDNPYDIADRPVPPNGAADTLLPLTAGKFSRTQVSGDAQNGWQAAYAGDGLTFTVTAQEFFPANVAQQRVRQVMETAGGVSETQALDLDPSFVLLTGLPDDAARMAWSRDYFFFDARATSRDALDSFMDVFPY